MATDVSGILKGLGSRDSFEVRAAIDRLCAALRGSGLAAGEEAALSRALLRLATHDRDEVRESVAHALRHLPPGVGADALETLAHDGCGAVSAVAHRTRERLREKAHIDELGEQEEELLARWLRHADVHPGGRAAAIRIAKKHTEMIVRKANHELGGSVGAVEGSLRELRARLADEPLDLAKAIEIADRTLSWMAPVVSAIAGLLDFVDQTPPEWRTICVEDAIRAAHGIASRGSAREVEVAIRSTGSEIEADGGKLTLAFRNLIQNAFASFDLRPGPHRLEIEARQESISTIVVSFRDNGSGMPDPGGEIRIFQHGNPLGSGMGLSVTRRIIEAQHHGRLRFASTRGEGTTVTVSLPTSQMKGADE